MSNPFSNNYFHNKDKPQTKIIFLGKFKIYLFKCPEIFYLYRVFYIQISIIHLYVIQFDAMSMYTESLNCLNV